MTETLRERLGLHTPKAYILKPNGVVGVDPTLLYGIELEIENLEADENIRAERAIAGMQYHKDGSLRNNGGEFVTLPMNFSTLSEVLNKFFKAHDYDEDNYSERCSVHVHANCQDLTLDQIRLIVCLYQILEKVLFNYVKADRDNNIFCVPLGESVIASRIMVDSEVLIQKAARSWRKYTALNLLPLYTQGTMEFRHMAGTCDVNFILQWCNIIGSLFKYAREHAFEDVVKNLMDLNTSSAYATFMQNIFQGDLYEVLAVGPYREFLEEGIINMKVMLTSEQPQEKTSKKTTLVFDDDDLLREDAPDAPEPNPWIVDAAQGIQPLPVAQNPAVDNMMQFIVHQRGQLFQAQAPIGGRFGARRPNPVPGEARRVNF